MPERCNPGARGFRPGSRESAWFGTTETCSRTDVDPRGIRNAPRERVVSQRCWKMRWRSNCRACQAGGPASDGRVRHHCACRDAPAPAAVSDGVENRAARTWGRPPQIVRLPRQLPLSRLSGATPTGAAISLCVSTPSSGSWATMVAASIGPTPGTLRKSATFSRQRGLERMVLFSSSSMASTRTCRQARCSSIFCPSHGWRSSPTVPLGGDHPR